MLLACFVQCEEALNCLPALTWVMVVKCCLHIKSSVGIFTFFFFLSFAHFIILVFFVSRVTIFNFHYTDAFWSLSMNLNIFNLLTACFKLLTVSVFLLELGLQVCIDLIWFNFLSSTFNKTLLQSTFTEMYKFYIY